MSTAVFNLSHSFNNGFTHTLATQLASSPSITSTSFRPPSSPPQPIPESRQGLRKEVDEPADFRTDSSCQQNSPLGTSLDVYHDCSVYHDCTEVTSSFASLPASMEGDPCMTSPITTSNNSCDTSVTDNCWEQQCAEERRLRQSAQATASELQSQLSAIRQLVLATHLDHLAVQDTAAPAGHAEGGEVRELPAAVAAVVSEGRGLRRALVELEAESKRGVEAARVAAAACARAAATADSQHQWGEEKAVLERRLEQSARVVEAMLKHSKKSGRRPEPWRQQLLSGALSLGGLVLGAGAAALIISRWNAPAPQGAPALA